MPLMCLRWHVYPLLSPEKHHWFSGKEILKRGLGNRKKTEMYFSSTRPSLLLLVPFFFHMTKNWSPKMPHLCSLYGLLLGDRGLSQTGRAGEVEWMHQMLNLSHCCQYWQVSHDKKFWACWYCPSLFCTTQVHSPLSFVPTLTLSQTLLQSFLVKLTRRHIAMSVPLKFPFL